ASWESARLVDPTRSAKSTVASFRSSVGRLPATGAAQLGQKRAPAGSEAPQFEQNATLSLSPPKPAKKPFRDGRSEHLEVLAHFPCAGIRCLRVGLDPGALHHHEVVDERATERRPVNLARCERVDRLP